MREGVYGYVECLEFRNVRITVSSLCLEGYLVVVRELLK